MDSASDKETSSQTVADRYSFAGECLYGALDNLFAGRPKLGRDGGLVQIDEMKFGRRKYNHGRMVDGIWLLGMIDTDTNDLRIEICNDNKRDMATLRPMILKHVEEGSIIKTDEWKSYNFLVNFFENSKKFCPKFLVKILYDRWSLTKIEIFPETVISIQHSN